MVDHYESQILRHFTMDDYGYSSIKHRNQFCDLWGFLLNLLPKLVNLEKALQPL